MTTQAIQFGATPMEPPFVLLPQRATVFADRAIRLKQRAQSSSMRDFLSVMADLAQAQHTVLQEIVLPAQAPLADAQWHGVLARLVELSRSTMPADMQPLLARLAAATPEQTAQWANRLLAEDYAALDLPLSPWIAAALQVVWTAHASQLAPATIARPEALNVCPCCGSHPVASAIHIGASEQGLRYLHCALCSTAWHMVRIQCVNCGSAEKMGYYHIESNGDAIQAEACDACHVYQKQLRLEKDTAMETIADDLASLPLDIMMADAGYGRFGLNLWMIPQQQP